MFRCGIYMEEIERDTIGSYTHVRNNKSKTNMCFLFPCNKWAVIRHRYPYVR